MSKCLIVGGGVVGLSLAYELAGHGLAVQVIDAGQHGREASWAGAGILPPAPERTDDPLEQLTALSNRLHVEWSQELCRRTQIDNGFRRCGAVYLARDDEEADRLHQHALMAQSQAIAMVRLSGVELTKLEPALLPHVAPRAAYYVADEWQLRNPRHLKALLMACTQRGVEVTAGIAAHDFEIRGDCVRRVLTSQGAIAADQVCVTTGAWTKVLAERLGCTLAIKPVRGQMALLSSPRQILSRIVNEGRRYLVPRPDGRVLAGSTEEDAGFNRNTTAGGVEGLLGFALGLVPELAHAQLERSWAGLRPSTSDGAPYLGPVPGLSNAFLAAGHFRSGLQLSTGTAVVIGQLLRGETPQIDLNAFRLDRGRDAESATTGGKLMRREIPLH